MFEDIRAEKFLNLGKKTNIQVQESQRITDMITPRHIVIKWEKLKIKREY